MVRWPFGRRRGGRPGPASAAVTDTPADARPSDRSGSWLRLPPLRPTVRWRAPVTIDVTEEPTAVRTGWLPRPGAARDTAVLRGMPVSRAGGLAGVVRVDIRAQRLPPLVLRMAARPAMPAARRPVPRLTEATPDLVGPPEAPAEPFIPAVALADLPWDHGWSNPEPFPAAAVDRGQSAAVAGQASAAAGQGETQTTGVVDPLGLLAMGVAEVAPPSQQAAPPRPTVLRRATLAESRRRGLTAPGAESAQTDAPGGLPAESGEPGAPSVPGDASRSRPELTDDHPVGPEPADLRSTRPQHAPGTPAHPEPSSTKRAGTKRAGPEPADMPDTAVTARPSAKGQVTGREQVTGPVATAVTEPAQDLPASAAAEHGSASPAGPPGTAIPEPDPILEPNPVADAPPRGSGPGLQRATATATSTVAQPRQPLVYRDSPRAGPIPGPPPPVTHRPGQPVASTESVPATIADRMRQVHVIDVSDVVIHRGPAVSLRARHLDARAFTEAGTVFLPAEAGDLGITAAALLGHELTHVAQQREFGAELPAENTEAGQELEAEARSVEQWLAGGPQPPPPLRHLRPVRPDPAATAEAPPVPVATAVTAVTTPSVQQPASGSLPELDMSAGQPLLSWSPDQGLAYGATGAALGAPEERGGGVAAVPAAAIQELLDRALAPVTGPPERAAPLMAGTAAQPSAPAGAWPPGPPPPVEEPLTPLGHPAQAASPTAGPAAPPTAELTAPPTTEPAVPSTAEPAPMFEPASATAPQQTGPDAGAGPAITPSPNPVGPPPVAPGPAADVVSLTSSTSPAPAAASPPPAVLPSAVLPSAVLPSAVLPSAVPVPAVPSLQQVMPPPSRPTVTGQRTPGPALVPAMPPAPPAGPTIPAAALASALTQATTDTLTGATVVPATVVAQAVAQQTASPSPAGPAVPIADIERLLASATSQPPLRLTLPPAPMPAPVPVPPPMPVPVPPPMPASQPAPVLPQRAPLDTRQPSPAATASLPWSPPQSAAPFQVTADLDGESPAPVIPAELASLAGLVGELIADEPPRDWLDLDNSGHLDRLTAKIYDRLSDRLRRDVLVQRERSGSLMDSW